MVNTIWINFHFLFLLYNDAINYKTQFITRAGTGTNLTSSSNYGSITFSFAPIIVWCIGVVKSTLLFDIHYGSTASNGNWNSNWLYVNSITTAFSQKNVMSHRQGIGFYEDNDKWYIKKSSDGKTFYWYCPYSSGTPGNYSDNMSGWTYTYFGIG